MMENYNELTRRLTKIEGALINLSNRIDELASDMGKYATQGQLKTSEANTKNLINQNSRAINDIQQQISMVVLPENSRYYLTSKEISDFRSNYQSIIAMMGDAERLYQSLVSYVAQFKIS